MTTQWSFHGNRIVSRWADISPAADHLDMQEDAPQISGSYLPPPPDFASHSPFGGATWLAPHLNRTAHPEDSN